MTGKLYRLRGKIDVECLYWSEDGDCPSPSRQADALSEALHDKSHQASDMLTLGCNKLPGLRDDDLAEYVYGDACEMTAAEVLDREHKARQGSLL